MFKTLHVYASRFFNESTVDSFLINLWCLINIRLISYVGVRIIKADKEATIVRLKVNRRTKNHLQSMYMGAQVIGAEIGPIFYAIKYCELNDLKINSEYTSVKAEFLKKTRSKYVYFYFPQAQLVEQALLNAQKTNERQYQDVAICVYDSDDFNDENLVSRFNFQATFRRRRQGKR